MMLRRRRPQTSLDTLRDFRDLGGLYNDYSFFGVDNEQLPGNFVENHRAKAPILHAFIATAIARSDVPAPSFLDLFAAQGYYGMVASRLGAGHVVAVDNDRDGYFGVAPEIARRLGTDVEFRTQDVADALEDADDAYDIVLNAGGLYHLEDPEPVLQASHAAAREWLIVQTVVSMASSDPAYFEAPAPGWHWGSRWCAESLDACIGQLGYRVVDRHFAELLGNDRPEDRGSITYLIDARV